MQHSLIPSITSPLPSRPVKNNLNGMNHTGFEVANIPLALYIHIPWCVKKCPYCDFNSHQLPQNDAVDMLEQYAVYVDALIADIKSQLKYCQGRTITSIFIGGGTPSLLPIGEYQRLFDVLHKVLPLAPDIEITLEANPGTLEHAPFEQYLALGINRLSIGVQTFDAKALTTLGRIHDPIQAKRAIKQAKQAGFNRVNVDLMHGLPKQTVEQALFDIRQAVDAGATHLSWYQLTIEPNTVFYRNTPVLPDEDNLADIEEQGSQLLKSLGFNNYEVSAWVTDNDNPCRHNLTYWQFGDYLAIGAGAHGKVSVQSMASKDIKANIYRFSKSRLPKDYMNYQLNRDSQSDSQTPRGKECPKMVGWQPIDNAELASEFMMNALRLTQGFDSDTFRQRTGMDYLTIESTLQQLESQGLICLDNQRITPTTLGRRYINKVIQAFL